MEPAGYPFPSPLSSLDRDSESELLHISKGSRATSAVAFVGSHVRESSSIAGTPSVFRDPTVLPSILSPPALPFGRSGKLTAPCHIRSSSSTSTIVSTPAISGLHVENTADLPSVFSETAPASRSLPTPPQEKHPHLRLPPFEQLGITNTFPDVISPGISKIDLVPLRIAPSLNSDELGDLVSLGGAPSLNIPETSDLVEKLHYRNQELPRLGHIASLTPPEEGEDFDWSNHRIQGTEHENSAAPESVPGENFSPMEAEQPPGLTGLEISGLREDRNADLWLQGAIDEISSFIDSAKLVGRTLRVLSHALPFPTTSGHAFSIIIECLRMRFPSGPLMFINLLHAVPGRFNLSDLPTSPPTTPGQPLGSSDGTGEDYFTAKVFESAMTTRDYASSLVVTTSPDPTSNSPTSSFGSQHVPLAAPSSLNLSIVERFIPPTSRNEFLNLFSLSKPSLLVDRMVELLPGNGCLIFIYPMLAGALTFCEKYLAPILDPVLRSMVVVNNFSADLSGTIGRMAAVQHMYDFETMNRKLKELCNDIQQESRWNKQLQQRLGGDTANFSIIHASKQRIILRRSVWSDWYIKQEKTRIKNAVALHFRYANRFLADTDTTPTQLIQELGTELSAKPYPPGQEPTGEDSKVELGLFVIKRDI